VHRVKKAECRRGSESGDNAPSKPLLFGRKGKEPSFRTLSDDVTQGTDEVSGSSEVESMITCGSPLTSASVRVDESSFFQYYAKKLVLLYITEDHWGPLKDASTIFEKVNQSSVAFKILDDEMSIKHAFVLNTEQTLHVADIIARCVDLIHP